MIGGAQSWAGPVLVGLGVAGLALGALVHGVARRPTLWTKANGADAERSSVWESLSVHLFAGGGWSLFFGLFVWRGPAADGWDVRLPGEAEWPVWAGAEWVYVCGYLTPLVIAWVAPTRGALRRYCGRLAVLSVLSGLCFLFLPVVSPPRAFVAVGDGWAERLLTMELGRADFGAVSLPSFHVFWAMLIASVLAERGRWWARLAWIWPVAMSVACVLNGAHAVADVAVSWVVWAGSVFGQTSDCGIGSWLSPALVIIQANLKTMTNVLNSSDDRYVDLQRRYVAISGLPGNEEVASSSYLEGELHMGELLEKLIVHRLVVVLGEAGSGKTEEFKAQVRRLRAEGKPAFFIRLEELAKAPLAEVIGREQMDSFSRWRRSQKQAYFFLDSVDEAKLTRVGDFHFAIRRFADAVGKGAIQRASVLISSRVSEWHPETDGPEVCACFGVPRERRSSTGDDGKCSGRPDALKEVQIAGLDREQVLLFAKERGLVNEKEFGAALDHAHAWEFARRPLDVVGLIELWRERGRIGTLTELVEFDVERKLRARSDRRDLALTPLDARNGAEALAAAAIFGRNFCVKVPDDALVTVEAFDGRAAVPESLNDDQYHALLARPIFDGASFGRIRFHHRRVREYLAAQWVEKRLATGCPLDELDALFFSRPEGRRVLRASLAPVAVWLCYGAAPWHGAMRMWLLEASPGIHLRYGDPQALPLDYKRDILRSLKVLATERKRTWLETDEEALTRLADPRLAAEISELILDASLAYDFRSTMLMLAHNGGLAGCVDAALQIVMSPVETEGLKNYAGIVLRDLAQPEHRRVLAEYVREAKSLPRSVTHMAIMELFPCHLDGMAALKILLKGERPRHSYSDMPRLLLNQLREGLRPDEAGPVLAELIHHLRSEPLMMHPHRGMLALSQLFSWAQIFLPVVLDVLLRKPLLTERELADGSRGLWLCYGLKTHSDEQKAQLEQLEESTRRHPALRRHHYYDRLADLRTYERDEPHFWQQIFWLDDVLMHSAQDVDLEWLLVDMTQTAVAPDQILALNLVLEFWEKAERPGALRRRIEKVSSKHPALLTMASERFRIARFSRLRRWWWQNVWRHLSSKYWWDHRWDKLRSLWFKAYNFCYLNLKVVRMARGKADGLLLWIIDHAPRNGGGNRWADVDWLVIRKQWGAVVAFATRRGCMTMWRRYEADLPYQKPNPSQTASVVVVSLAGLHLAWETGFLQIGNLNADEARRATRYAMDEINGAPPWLPELMDAQPEACGQVLCEAAEGEWYISEKPRERWQVLQTLAWYGLVYGDQVRARLLRLLEAGDPPQVYSLNLVLTALIHSTQPPRDELRALARTRCQSVSAVPFPLGLSLWFTIWLQLEPLAALGHWEAAFAQMPEADGLFISIASSLSGRDVGHDPRFSDTSYLTAEVLGRLIPIAFRHVRPTEDLHHGEGGYTPCARDDAQDFRQGLIRRLSESADACAATIIRKLSAEQELSAYRDSLLHACDELQERHAEARRWQPADVRVFARAYEIEPQTDYDLYRVVCRRLSDIKNDVERSDTGLRRQLHEHSSEANLRTWLANELTRRRNGSYSVEQEAEIDREQRPDLRAENPNTAPVPIEIKWACDWSLPVLLERLENQLFGQYLRAHDARYGVFFVGVIKPGRQWDNPAGGRRLSFTEVVVLLEAKATELSANTGGRKLGKVIAIEFRP